MTEVTGSGPAGPRQRPDPGLRVLVACDSFEGSLSAVAAGTAICTGWAAERPADTVRQIPIADGGPGTLQALAAALPQARLVPVTSVTGPDGRPVDTAYLMLCDRTAVVEFAAASGLSLTARQDALTANSRGTGEVVAQAIADGARRLVIGLGGAASSDGGAGLLRALGLQVTDRDGWAVGPGAVGLLTAVRVERSTLVQPPPAGVIVLTDVDNPLLGPRGAAAVFGPQKGATPHEVALIEQALTHWAQLLGADPNARRGGAAGGAAAALAAVWGATPAGGSEWVADQVGLDDAVQQADVVVTGAGRFDRTSLCGNPVGLVLAATRRHGKPAVLLAESVDPPREPGFEPKVEVVEVAQLDQLAGPAGPRDAAHRFRMAGETAARLVPARVSSGSPAAG